MADEKLDAAITMSVPVMLGRMCLTMIRKLLYPNGPRIITNDENHINIAPILVDGLGISNVADEVINDRRTLGEDGVVVIVCSVSREKQKIISGPDCQMRGFVFAKEAVPILKSLSQIFVEEVEKALKENAPGFKDAINNIKERSKRFIRKENGREPLVIPIIIPTF